MTPPFAPLAHPIPAERPRGEFAPVPVADRDYADWYDIGEAWVREWWAANKRRPATDYAIRELVHGWMQINCPLRLLAEHRAAVKAAREAEYGPSEYRVGQYGLEKVA